MSEKLAILWPEIILFLGTCVVMILGLSPKVEARKACSAIAAIAIILAGLVASLTPSGGSALLPELMNYSKGLIAIIGLLLLLLANGTVDRAEERAIAAGRRTFDPLRATRGEFYAFFLFSLTGLMLCASADDLIWLFLALELTSLPTYVMVTISTRGTRSQEAGVKYFFLGALGAAIFLYGFALLYGGTGTTNLTEMHAYFAAHGLNPIATAGLVISIVGIGFKIAAVPMHFYTADVYQGAAASVSAFLAFVPKTAGFLAILAIVAAPGWAHGTSGESLPPELRVTLWVIAALTMTVGNTLALMQTSIKRILAYSSIAHTGYMLVGVIAGPGDGSFTQNGVSAVLFYLLTYGVLNLGAFAVVACLEHDRGDTTEPDEADHIDDLKGLCKTKPVMGWVIVISSLGLLGLPPLLGFFGKVPLFTSGIAAGEIALVLVLAINSAIAAFYYLRLVNAALLTDPDPKGETLRETPLPMRRVAAVVATGGVIVLSIAAGGLMSAAERAGTYAPMTLPQAQQYLEIAGRAAQAAELPEPP